MLSGRDGKRRLQRGEYTVLLAFTGVDGALLLPPVPAQLDMHSEGGEAVRKALQIAVSAFPHSL